MKGKRDPKVIVFCCNWCSYAGADLAGVSRLQMEPHFVIIRTMCSGRIEPSFLVDAFSKGADGVLIAGCHPGDCHYIDGNYKTIRRFYLLRRIIEQMGIDPQRIKLEWISASEGTKFQTAINTFINKIAEMDPFPQSTEFT
ncbi:hydrogenase iron-sulfur subunit [bacterium]|nr:hydrogenase iron-sulfur subunit [bacterium]